MRAFVAFSACLAMYVFSSPAAFAVAPPDELAMVPGDFPDPSIIRVGDTYWSVATTSEWAPEFPLLSSKDLVHWQQQSAVFQVRPSWSTGSFWAPEISFYKGKYFVYYGARKKNGNMCVAVATAAKPAGPYEDHGPLVCQKAGSIDPMAIAGEDGARYLIWKEDGNSIKMPTPLWAQKLSADGRGLVGKPKEILRNDAAWEGSLIEGPFVYRHKGWFYLFYSGNGCCGRDCSYAMGVARSRKLLGPWIKNPGNPILAGNKTWKCPGHGSLVEDRQGSVFLMYHAYSARDSVFVGRQALIDEVRWGSDGWPHINDGKGPGNTLVHKLNPAEQWRRLSFSDEFRATSLSQGWQRIQDDASLYHVEPLSSTGRLQIKSMLADGNEPFSTVLAKSSLTGLYTAETQVELNAKDPKSLSGLGAYGDAKHFIGLTVGGQKITLWKADGGAAQLLAALPLPDSLSAGIFLRMTVRKGSHYSFDYSVDQKTWKQVGTQVDGEDLPPWDESVRIALAVGGPPGSVARFNSLKITPADAPKEPSELASDSKLTKTPN